MKQVIGKNVVVGQVCGNQIAEIQISAKPSVGRKLLFASLLVSASTFLFSGCGFSALNQKSASMTNFSSSGSSFGAPFLVNDAKASGYAYAYAPSIIYTNGSYHAYFCSTGNGSSTEWDIIRHETSPDLNSWTGPDVVLTPNQVEQAACDPSIVRFDAGDGAYYYLMYGGYAVGVSGVHFLARSVSPDGPFLKLTDRSTWEQAPKDPHAIIYPQTRSADTSVYGAGQPAIVVKDGTVYQFYNDTTTDAPNMHNQILMRTSPNMIDWSPAVRTNVQNASVDVKYEYDSDSFVMFEILNEHASNSEVGVRTSKDGITWSDSTVICDTNCMPPYANNIGVSGDDQGHLIDGQMLVAYGSPYNLSKTFDNTCKTGDLCWGHWSLYGQMLTHTQTFGDVPPPPACSDAAGSIPGLTPIYRLFGRSEHMYSICNTEGTGFHGGYVAEGEVFQVAASASAGMVPLYRCWVNGQHFLTLASNCEGATMESTLGYVQTTQTGNLQLLYRYYNTQTGDHLVTVSTAEGQAAMSVGYHLESTLGYAWSSNAATF